MRSLRGIAAVLGIFTVVCWIMVMLSVVAQTADLPAETPTHQKVPEAAGSGSSEPLGDKLNRSSGVIRPPAGIDPGLTQSPPASGSNMPVMPPPGSAGGERDVNPK